VPRKNKRRGPKNRVLLASSEKEDAELSMIVDLLRNDLGKSVPTGVCGFGNIKGSRIF
jgi:anthranilate/para-aminobenzoate synthase component I